MEPIESVCLCGAGFLGWQISLQCASHGIPVRLFDISEEALERASEHIRHELKTWTSEEKITPEEVEATLSQVSFHDDLAEAVDGVDLVIEAVPERLDLKREVFAQLDSVCDDATILATNSSSIRISKIEDATRRLDRVLNTHFYNTPWRRSIVELMRGTGTSDETLERVREFMVSIGITPLMVLRKSTGFIFNRVWRAIKRECLHLVDQGVASFQDVDRAWMTLYETPYGPFGMMDRVGLDVIRDIEMVYYEESGADRDAPPKMLLEMIERGELGVKTGKGFYKYPDPAYLEPGFLKGKS
ncbi:3-hydroxyacyl-CoA dehydrogenase family protein [Candidatus Bathyarchaeota archaeon]|nr:3-hydroxyacyl-CoA dehydrogenase family protein [Candidatus Bathyarchaeota archaeon]